ncbi:hypothetical protein ACIRJM_22820 [Streptomyces sp. NPDC102405]|jgi:hypothetical protein|uniref:hypothetical protein n=1 Tax=Streptomyces sp. NPDC102405 TaxID=3366170 RepID=UPI00381E2CD7
MSWGEGSMNWAELRDLVEALPEDSATRSALSGDLDGRRWNSSTFIGAATYNALLMLVRISWMAHLKGQPPEMEPIEAPRFHDHEVDAEAKAAADEEAAGYLESFSPGRSEQDQAELDHWHSKIRELEAAQ